MKRDADILWQYPDGAFSWAKAAALHLGFVLGPVFGGRPTVDLKLLDAQSAKKAAAENQDLGGEVVVEWPTISNTPLRLQVLLPYHGVFLKRTEDAAMPGLAVWSSWLGELPGFRQSGKPRSEDGIFGHAGLPESSKGPFRQQAWESFCGLQ